MTNAEQRQSGRILVPYTVSILILSYLLSSFDRQIVGVLANDIKADFGLTDSEIGALQGFTFAAFYAAAGLPIARLVDGLSRVRLAAVFVGGWSAMTTLCGVAGNFPQLLFYRAGTAIAEAGLPLASLSIFADLLERRKLAAVGGLLLAAPYIGGGLALLLGGWLLEWSRSIVASSFWPSASFAAWHLVFLAAGIPGIVLALLMWLTLHEPARRQIAEDDIEKDDVPRLGAVVRLLAMHKAFWLPFMLAVPFQVLTVFAQLAWMPAMLMREYHLSPSAAGLLVGPVMLALGVTGSLLAGWLIARQSSERTACYSISLLARVTYLAAPLSLLYFIPSSLTMTVIAYAAQILLMAIFTATWPPAIQMLVQNRIRARTLALVNLAGVLIGQGLGPFAVGLMNDHILSGDNLQFAIGCTVSLSLGIAASAMVLAARQFAILGIEQNDRCRSSPWATGHAG